MAIMSKNVISIMERKFAKGQKIQIEYNDKTEQVKILRIKT